MNLIQEIESFKRKEKLNIEDFCVIRMKWKFNNTKKSKEDLYNIIQQENIYVNFKGIKHIKDINIDDFYRDLIMYKKQNKKLFDFVFKSIFK